MRLLMDTGPWVALIDRSESRHAECAKWFREFKGEIFSTEAVLTEVIYLLNFSSQAQSAAIDFILKGAITLVPSSIESLRAVKGLIKKYRDLPMDFADATLVSVAEDLGIYDIATFDIKDFGIYRPGRKQFVVVMPFK
jgi:predicted nucleic acid-binding protein